MRILHLVHQYLPERVGGTELYTAWLANGLSQQGHQVTVFFRRSVKRMELTYRDDKSGVRVWAIATGQITPVSRFWTTFGQRYILDAFYRVIEQTQPNLVHIQHLMGLPVALTQYIQDLDIPFIITLHDYWWVCANAQLLTNYSQQVCNGPQAYLNCARCALARIDHPRFWLALPGLMSVLAWRNGLLRQVMQAARRLIVPTKFVGDWYAAYGAPVDRLQVIPHGIPLAGLQRRQTRQSNNPIRFAYIGGLSWQKGAHVLIEAFNGIEEGAELWIAGDEDADPAYAAHLHALASENVHFLGKLARAEVWEILAQVDVLVVPSLWYETFAFVVSEAFAAGIPVVASRLGPLADRVEEGVDGLLVPPGDVDALRVALLQFLEDSTLLPRLRAGIRPVHTIEAHVKEIEAVYQAVLKHLI
jgi:glycosyltransferase involved in cell wall biosynthesis